MKPICFLTAVLSISVSTIVSAQDNSTRKIFDNHFHALKWNSFGTPPPPNEITGVKPTAKSDSEEQVVMLSALEKNHVVKTMLSGVPKLVDAYMNTDKGLFIRG